MKLAIPLAVLLFLCFALPSTQAQSTAPFPCDANDWPCWFDARCALVRLGCIQAEDSPDILGVVECLVNPPPEDPRCVLRRLCNDSGCVGVIDADAPSPLPCEIVLQCVRWVCDNVGAYGCVGTPPPDTNARRSEAIV